MSVTRILDHQGRHCGLLLNYENAISIEKWNSKYTYEFVLLSIATLFKLSPRFVASIQFSINNGMVHEPIFDSRFYRLRYREMGLVNVILIEWCGDFAERIAIACIYIDA